MDNDEEISDRRTKIEVKFFPNHVINVNAVSKLGGNIWTCEQNINNARFEVFF
jgi:hypothetical protein